MKKASFIFKIIKKAKRFYRLTPLFFTFFAMSCATTIIKQVEPPYTNVEKILSLKPDMTTEQVSKSLGIPPYDVYNIQDEGSSILVYHYRVKDRSAEVPENYRKKEILIHSEEYQNVGAPWYQRTGRRMFVLFKDGKMQSLLTEEGKEYSEFILLVNNNLKFLSKAEMDKLKVIKIDDMYIVQSPKESTTIIKIEYSADKKARFDASLKAKKSKK